MCVSVLFIGELLGVDYLLSQTGQPLRMDPDSEETENLLEDVQEDEGEEEDEGIEEDQTPDDTVMNISNLNLSLSLLDDSNLSISSQPCPGLVPSSSQPASSSLAAASFQPASSSLAAASFQPAATFLAAPTMLQPGVPASPDESGVCKSMIMCKEIKSLYLLFVPDLCFQNVSLICFFFSQAVDDSGVPGMDRVDGLADYLVELRNQPSLALTNQQVRNIYCLATFPL